MGYAEAKLWSELPSSSSSNGNLALRQRHRLALTLQVAREGIKWPRNQNKSGRHEVARRPSDSVLGVGILLAIGVIATVPKEVWIGIAVVAVIGIAFYFFVKEGASEENTARAPLPMPALGLRTSEVRDTDSSVTSASCWVNPNRYVEVKGVGSLGGMLYCGKRLASISGSGVEPALVNPGLPVAWPKDGASDRMSYWPSYSQISQLARGEYLQWLADGRKAPTVQMGCVFLFFYGLERRVLSDARTHPEVAQELPAIFAEVQRLLSIYGSNGSFHMYASQFLDFATATGTKGPFYKTPPPPQGQRRALTLHHKIALGQSAVDGAPLPAAWAYSWLFNDERYWPRVPVTRCEDEFRKLFLEGYAEKFGDGMKLPVNKTKLKALYRPASASFGFNRCELTGVDVPDITVLERPFNQLKEIAEAATAKLEPYSRYVGRNPDQKNSREAMVLLPPRLWPPESVHSLASWLVSSGTNGGAQVATFRELLQHFPAGPTPKKDEYRALATGLEQLGVGIEPDVRWGGPVPGEESKVVCFPLSTEAITNKPSALYSAATLTLHLGAAVAAADGQVSQDEQQHLEGQLERWLHLDASELTRLRAHLTWLLVSPPPLATLKKRVSALKEEQKRAIATFLIAMVQSNGGVSPAAIKVLTKIYRLFGLDEKELYSEVHAAATEPVAVRPATTGPSGFKVPPKPDRTIVLDHERISALIGDSERVSAMLGAIFAEDDKASVLVVPLESEETSAVASIAGLDQSYSELVRVLISRDTWTRAELEDLATDRDIMLDGALEHINEAFLDAHNEPLLDGEDPVSVNKNAVKEIEAA